MKKIILTLLVMVIYVSTLFTDISIKIKNQLTLGDKTVIFDNIDSIAERENGAFFLLDDKSCFVYHFSMEGKLLGKFGGKGQGPGEFIEPHSLQLKDNRLIVNESRDYLSVFDLSGQLKERVKTVGGLAVTLLDGERYYVWEWTRDAKKQLIKNKKGDVIRELFSTPKSAFSVSEPDETGRKVMFNYFAEEYSPGYQFAFSGSFCSAARNDGEEIVIMDGTGEVLKTFRHEIPAAHIKPEEKKYFEDRILSNGNFPPRVKQKMIALIPEKKNIILRMLISLNEGRLWVIENAENSSVRKSAYRIHVFTLPEGKRLGAFSSAIFPLSVSKRFIYASETNDADDLLLVRREYSLH